MLVLESVKQKALIFKNTSNLKGTNKFVNDVLPEERSEEQRRKRQIIAANKKLPKEQQQMMKMEKGKLLIGEKGKGAGQVEFNPKVQVPTAHDILCLTDEDRSDLQEVEMLMSEQRIEKGSKFVVYGAPAVNKSTIRRMYTHLKLKHPEATHITSAYRLQGLDKAHDEGCCDDMEHGLGRRLLKILVDRDIRQCVVFSVRQYGGKKLFDNRFNIPMEMIEQLLNELQDGRTATSKLPEQTDRSSTRTIKQRTSFKTRGRRQAGRHIGMGASPRLPAKEANNNVREFLQSLRNDPSIQDESDVQTCPTSATSDNDKAMDEEGYMSIVEERSRRLYSETERWTDEDQDQTIVKQYATPNASAEN